jgi:hypothetical protein
MSKLRAHGYVFADHRASPGIPEATARKLGLEPSLVREGAVMEADTLHCIHCGGHWIKNPLRTRERPWCTACDTYMCDNCAALSRQPGYVHMTVRELADKIASGQWEMIGGTMAQPILRRVHREE